jgi:hypothetical protein
MGNLPLLVQIELQLLRHFFEHTASGVYHEWADIEARSERGEIEEFEDLEREMDYPLSRSDFLARMVYYELSAILESQLQELASSVWQRQTITTGRNRRRKTVDELHFDDVRKIIESGYGLHLDNIEGWDSVDKLRTVANAYKHRRGHKKIKDWTKNPVTGGWEFRYDTNLDEARDLLALIPAYLERLKTLINAQEQSSSHA